MSHPSSAAFSDTVVATPDPPSTGVANPIHDEQGAAAAGYSGALVAGVRTYGWSVATIVRALGTAWLNSGWVDFSLKRPLFAGERLTTNVTPGQGHWTLECTAGDDQRCVLAGTAGLGDAPWLADLNPPAATAAGEAPSIRPGYDLNTVPLGEPLIPLGAWVRSAGAASLVSDDLAVTDDRYRGEGPVPIHPYFLAARMAPLTRHNFTYGPTIHARSQIQHRREGVADQEITVGARIVDAFDRNGHWYQVLDGVVSDAAGTLCLIRHHTIFRPRGT